MLARNEYPANLLERIEQEIALRYPTARVSAETRDGRIVLRGAVEDIGHKGRIALMAADLAGTEDIDNQILLEPETELDDDEIQKKVVDSLVHDRAVDETSIAVTARDGVVTLRGTVPGLESKRHVGVLAWWVPGVRDVRNLLDLRQPEDDNDSAITDSVRLALDKDPIVDSLAISVVTARGTVTLRGAVYSEEARDAAEHDAWFVLGVRNVDNRIVVSPAAPPPGPIPLS